mgnify:CR=1 FL=1
MKVIVFMPIHPLIIIRQITLRQDLQVLTKILFLHLKMSGDISELKRLEEIDGFI